MSKEQTFEKLIDLYWAMEKRRKRNGTIDISKTGWRHLCVITGKTCVIGLKALRLAVKVERKGWQKDFAECAMKNHSDFVKSLGVPYEVQTGEKLW